MLMSQRRSELAEKELRQALVHDPNDALTHSLLAACLVDQEKFTDATDAAGQAIHLAPDEPYSHYMMGQVMYHGNHFDEAREAANTAVELDPWDPDYFALISAIELEQHRWSAALQAAEQGLEVEPDHVRCINLRATSLMKLGRAEEAGQSLDVALQNQPDNSFSHANKGWTKLHQGKPREALVHFREALRIDPNSEFARSGIVEAMKARNPIYRWLLSWFLFLSRLSPRVQIFLVLGILFGQRLLVGLADSVPVLEPLVPFILFGYLGFVWMTWCGPMLFNVVLRFDTFGRLVLSTKERHQSTIVGVYLLVGLGWVVAAAVTGQWVLAILGIPFALALIPLNGVFAAPNPTLFWIMAGVTAVATWFAIQACIPGISSPNAFTYSILTSLYSTWASLFIIGSRKPKKI